MDGGTPFASFTGQLLWSRGCATHGVFDDETRPQRTHHDVEFHDDHHIGGHDGDGRHELRRRARHDGHDWQRMAGNGAMDLGGMTVTETFPVLHDAGPTTLEYTDDAAGFSGQLAVADVVVATVDAGGHLVPTSDCP